MWWNFTKQPVDQHRLINLYNFHAFYYVCMLEYNILNHIQNSADRVADVYGIVNKVII